MNGEDPLRILSKSDLKPLVHFKYQPTHYMNNRLKRSHAKIGQMTTSHHMYTKRKLAELSYEDLVEELPTEQMCTEIKDS